MLNHDVVANLETTDDIFVQIADLDAEAIQKSNFSEIT